MRMFNWIRIVGVVMVLALVGACAKRQPEVTPAPPPEDSSVAAPADDTTAKTPPPPAPERVEDRQPVAKDVVLRVDPGAPLIGFERELAAGAHVFR